MFADLAGHDLWVDENRALRSLNRAAKAEMEYGLRDHSDSLAYDFEDLIW